MHRLPRYFVESRNPGGAHKGSSSVLFLKRIRAYFFWVYTRTLDFRSTQGCTLPGDFAHSNARLR